MNNKATVYCKGLSKSFGTGDTRTNVIRQLDFCVSNGEKAVITGASGSGKSTLLHLIGGLERADSGRISVCGHDLEKLGEREICDLRNERIGFIYQAHHLLPEFTVMENVAIPRMIRRERLKDCMADAADLLERSGLGARMRHKPHQLSGGERQRVAVCRALITRPSLVLADEPTGSLDHGMAQCIIDLMLELEVLETLIMVTHNHHLVARMDRHWVLEQGRLTKIK